MKTRLILLWLATCCGFCLAAEKKPLTNADVVKMVKAQLPESTILLAIQSGPKEFDSSVDALIELKSNGVSPAVLDAMLGPVGPVAPSVASPQAVAPETTTPPQTSSHPPDACAIDGSGARTRLTSTTFRLVETKAKGSSLAALATDPAVTQLMNSGALNMLGSAGGKLGGTLNAVSGLAGGIGKKLFKGDEATLTYVYALDGTAAAQHLSSPAAPRFEVNFADLTGAKPDEFEPALVKVSATPQGGRMLGAIKAKKSAFTENTPRELNIVEDRVSAAVNRLAPGRVEIIPAAAFQPGDYAIVLRPIATAKKKFILQEFEQAQGEAAVLRLLWNFSIEPLQ